MSSELSAHRAYYRALIAKDRRLDGKIYFAVRTTGIYCRPVCPARVPLERNVEFHRTAASAEAAGYRPCLRCRPETSPGTPAWIGAGATVHRALRLIAEGGEPALGTATLASRLGVGERQLHRLFVEHLGASPQAVISTRRLDFARRLLDETALPVSEIAFASGFESIRRFNSAFKARFARAPRDVRRADEAQGTRSARADAASVLRLRAPYRPPYDWASIHQFLAARAIPGVESCADGAYRRSFELGAGPSAARGWLEVREARSRPGHAPASLELTLHGATPAVLMEAVARARRLFDLDADPEAIAAHLGRDASLRPLLKAHPGLRVPGAWCGFELAVRAILGQQVSVAAASTLAGRIVERWGVPVNERWGAPVGVARLFAPARALAEADLREIGLTAARASALQGLAREVAAGRLSLDERATAARDPREIKAALVELPGIGPWTAEYVAMRALRDSDAFPTSDLVLAREVRRLGCAARVESWRPWRAYAAMGLWRGSGEQKPKLQQ